MRMLQTESADIKTFEELGWKIMPLNIPVLVIEPPVPSLELTEVEEEKTLPGDLYLVPPHSGRSIDALPHRALLRESLVKHKEIWRTLAEK